MQLSEPPLRPRIGVPVRLSSAEGADPRVGEANELFDFIVELLRLAGADPVLLSDPGGLPAAFQELDGLVLPGGGDIDPELYGEKPGAALYDVNAGQDALDVAAARAGIDAGIPVLGICRGHQLLNVLYGGTLIQDMHPSSVEHQGLGNGDGTDGGAGSEWAWHDVGLTPGSRVAGFYASYGSTVRIASGHHQAVARVGEGLLVTAVAGDGTVEALEDPSRWVTSMQWHPEAAQLPEEERLAPFRGFVEVCRKRG